MLKTIIKATKGDEVIFEKDYLTMCHRLDLSYNYTKMNKFPFEYKGWTFSKIIIDDISKYYDSFTKNELAEIIRIAKGNKKTGLKP